MGPVHQFQTLADAAEHDRMLSRDIAGAPGLNTDFFIGPLADHPFSADKHPPFPDRDPPHRPKSVPAAWPFHSGHPSLGDDAPQEFPYRNHSPKIRAISPAILNMTLTPTLILGARTHGIFGQASNFRHTRFGNPGGSDDRGDPLFRSLSHIFKGAFRLGEIDQNVRPADGLINGTVNFDTQLTDSGNGSRILTHTLCDQGCSKAPTRSVSGILVNHVNDSSPHATGGPRNRYFTIFKLLFRYEFICGDRFTRAKRVNRQPHIPSDPLSPFSFRP
jgi:hypothetical protein